MEKLKKKRDIKKLTKYITPLRIVGVWMLVWAISEYFKVEKMIEQGYEPGLGGLGMIAFGIISLSAFGFDLVLSLTLKKNKWNWLAQSIVILIFILFVILS